MPELPDVEVMRRYLDGTALHHRIERVERLDPVLLHRVAGARLRASLTGSSLEHTYRHGKWLFVHSHDGPWLVLHFGMTGRLEYFAAPSHAPAHTRMLLVFDNGYRLAYDCQRRLGRISLTDDVERFVAEHGLGPDALALDLAGLTRALGHGRGAVKATLLNQHAVAGLGNIYADEVLFQAGIHPRTPMNELDADVRRSLARRIRTVLTTSVARGADPERLPRTWLLHRRHEGAGCPHCGGRVERTRVGGRTAYYCPACQPGPSRSPGRGDRDPVSHRAPSHAVARRAAVRRRSGSRGRAR